MKSLIKNVKKEFDVMEQNRNFLFLMMDIILNFKIKPVTYFIGSLSILLLSCSQVTSDLPGLQRPIPVELPADNREEYRKLPLEGAHNFRELGGYRTQDNKSVKWGILYRSDELHALTAEDIKYLERLKLNTLIDFRSMGERENEPDPILKETNIRLLPIDVLAESSSEEKDKTQKEIQEELFSGERDLSNLLVDANKDFATTFTPTYKIFIDTLIENNGLPLVFHCSAGKDRAGFAAAIVLSILGVPRDIIIQDYLATNAYSKDEIDRTIQQINISSLFQADTDNIRKVLEVEERYIQAAFDAIDKEWGSMELYFKNGLMLSESEIEKIKSLYLE